MYCENCGASVSTDSKFCPQCGKRLDDEAVDREQRFSNLRQAQKTQSTWKPLLVTQTKVKPRSIVIAVSLLWLYMAISLVRMFTDLPYMLEEMKKTADIDGGLPLIILIVGFGASAGLLVFFILKISAGRNWARIAFLVMFIVGIPLGISQVSAEFARSPFIGALFVAQFGLFGYALFLLFTEPGSGWFRKVAAV